MAVLWPPSVPTDWLVSGAFMSLGHGFVETDMDAGPARRDARPPQPDAVRVDVIMTNTQSATFLEWYRDVLLGGALPFQVANQFTGQVYLFELNSVSLTVVTPEHHRYALEMVGVPG